MVTTKCNYLNKKEKGKKRKKRKEKVEDVELHSVNILQKITNTI